jgi:uncharacterized protein YuzE
VEETGIVESEEVQPGVILDFAKNGRVVGIGIPVLRGHRIIKFNF